MIGKDDFFSLLYVKSKLAFKTTFSSLSKLEKRLKIHLHCKFKKVLLENKFVFIKFLKLPRHNCATNLAHNTDVPINKSQSLVFELIFDRDSLMVLLNVPLGHWFEG